VVASRLAAGGVAEVVVSPGSRNTAYALAMHRHRGLRVHDVVDERAAGFFALGMARATGRPAALLCTSGTAPAHYLPAVIEATRARLPLVVVSADRPLELVGCEAPQAIDQVKLFGDHVVHFVDLGTPDPAPAAVRGVARAVSQAVLASRWPVAGAVHLNARARKPFEPEAPQTDAGRAAVAVAEAVASWAPDVAPPRSLADPAAVARVAERLSRARRGLIVAGPAPVAARGWRDAVAQLAEATGFGVYAEATSQQRWWGRPASVAWVDGLDLAAPAMDWEAFGAPQVVLEVGRPLVAGSHGRALAGLDAERIVLSDGPWADWQGTARALLLGEVGHSLQALAGAVAGSADPSPWRTLAHTADAATDAALAEAPHTEGAAMRSLGDHVPAGTRWVLGNSLSVRLADWFVRRQHDGEVLHQRGANGIDGLIAGAAGAARATPTPTLLVLGDVAAWHDLGSLALARSLDTPLVVVVLHNGGGRIFDLLPVAGHPAVSDAMRAHLTTPDPRGFAAAQGLYDVAWRQVSPTEVGPAAAEALAQPATTTVLEVPTAPHGNAELLQALHTRLCDMLSG